MIRIHILRFLIIWLVSYAGKIAGREIDPEQVGPVALADNDDWNASPEPFKAISHTAVASIPYRMDTKLHTRRLPIKRSNRVKRYYEKGLQKWDDLNQRLQADLPRDLPTLSPDQLRQGGWNIQNACGAMPSESDLAVLLQSDPSTSSGDFCFDMLVQDKDHPGDDSTDGIVFHNKYCPGYGGLEVIKAYKETTDENGKKHSARTSWSNVTWALWSSNCENEDQAAGLWWLAHKNLVNPDTLKIIDEMRDDNEFETTERPGSGTYLVYTLKPRDDSKKEADPASRYFFALFGSPNGNGGYYILKDHMSALRKNIAEIRVYQQVSWDDDEEEYIDEDLPEMVFILSKRQR